MAVSYSEIERGSERFRGDVFSSTRLLECAWADRFTLWGELRYTAHPAYAAAIATSCDIGHIEGANLGTGSVAAYEKATLLITYETAPLGQGQEDGSFRAEWVEPTAEFLTLAREGFRWVSDEKVLKEGEEPAKLQRGLDYVIRFTNLTEVPDWCRSYVGRINVGPVSPVMDGISHWVFEAQTLLFNPPTLENGLDADGDLVWASTVRLTYKPNFTAAGVAKGWNWFWRGDAGGFFDQIEDTSDNVIVHYPTADFSVI